ncbi:hypothetical protein KPNJ1_00174 [Klebsiella pneumoniae 30660/NJST258_1]|uniref:Uncharacterized protein n=1 Tax=Klebsiella pneumoniae 30684/NJST258_2 TaxID=1420013 RepID=W8UMV7_KLEPN|nr:hypothetical protein KPNJ2_00173 [Klebsiella pneumoniae 30684/NJST258_2]AHM82580.1 hypothetical protein KPNJ1_00174 [Klebsiella pneumoniae 30660/NJST258_1]
MKLERVLGGILIKFKLLAINDIAFRGRQTANF